MITNMYRMLTELTTKNKQNRTSVQSGLFCRMNAGIDSQNKSEYSEKRTRSFPRHVVNERLSHSNIETCNSKNAEPCVPIHPGKQTALNSTFVGLEKENQHLGLDSFFTCHTTFSSQIVTQTRNVVWVRPWVSCKGKHGKPQRIYVWN